MTLLIIPNIWFVRMLAALTGYLTFLTTKGGLTDNRHQSYWRRLTKRGKEVLLILVIIAIVLACQELNIQSKNKLSEQTLKIEQSKRDALITNGINKGVDASRKTLFEDISKAFSKQQLQLDTVKKEVVRIRDSARAITNNYVQKEDPVILIDSTGIKLLGQHNKERNYSINFKSSDAASSNFNILCYIVTSVKGKAFEVAKGDIFSNDLQIPKNGVWAIGFTTNIDPDPFELYINIVGTYSNLDNTKRYKINNVYVYNIKNTFVRTLIGIERHKILNIVKNNSAKEIKLKK